MKQSPKKSQPQSPRKERSNVDISKGKVLYDNVVVRPITIEQTGKVKHPAQYEDKDEYGIVVGVGEGRLLTNGTVVPLKVDIGDLIFFEKYSAVKVRNEGTDYLIIREEDIRIIL